MKTSTIKGWFVVHKWTSLVCTLFMLLLCVTGLPLIFAHEIDHAIGRSIEPPAVADPSAEADLDAIVADARARWAPDEVKFVVRALDEPEFWFVSMGEDVTSPETTVFAFYDARTGAMLHEYPLGTGVMNVILRLHVDLFAGLWGMLFLGLMGVLLLVSIVSGVVLYGPYMTRLRFGTVRRERSSRLKWLDLHNLLGIVTLVWLFVVGATGVVNTLSVPIFRHWQATQLAEMVEPHAEAAATGEASAARAYAAALEAEPDMALSFMAFPGTRFSSASHYVAFMQGTTPLSSKLLKPLLIDGHTGEVLERRALPPHVMALVLSQPLHFGDYGGMPLKVLWALLDVLSIVVLVSGVALWVRRRKVSFESWWSGAGEDAGPTGDPRGARGGHA